MHGIIHSELKKYVETKHGHDAWDAILEKAGLKGKLYLPNNAYPDGDAFAIVGAASALTRVSPENILEDFGEFIVPDLLNLYRLLLKPEWRTLDMLMHTEETIHRVVRMKTPGAEPPQLKFEKVSENQVKFFYSSKRKMAAVAKGIIRGVAKHYKEQVDIKEEKKPDGSSEMLITVT